MKILFSNMIVGKDKNGRRNVKLEMKASISEFYSALLHFETLTFVLQAVCVAIHAFDSDNGSNFTDTTSVERFLKFLCS